jgi:hypothetical protein
VRVTGGDPDRLEVAARHAAEAGLEVWWSPFTCDLTAGELLDLLGDCAERAERLRRQGAEVVLLTGSELSLFTVGFLPGDRLEDRLGLLATPGRLGELLAEVAGRFRDDIRAFVAQAAAQGKPAAVTEFGCTTHRGAADLGGRGDAIVEWDDDGRPRRLRGDHRRDEAEQATYLREVLAVLDAEGVDTAFVNTFARFDLPHRSDPRQDLDMASYGVVKVLGDRPGHTYPDMAWEPKAAFTALADHFNQR